MTVKTFKLTAHITIFSIVLLVLFTSCGSELGFINSNNPFSWFTTIVFLIVTFLPALFSLILISIKANSEDWSILKVLSFIYGGGAALMAIIMWKTGKNGWEDFNTWMLLTAIVAIVVGFSAIKISKKKLAVETKCPKCGQLSALQEINRVCTGSRSTTVTRTVETKNRNGDVIATTEVPVPATNYFYDIHLTCKFCKHKEIWKTSEIYED